MKPSLTTPQLAVVAILGELLCAFSQSLWRNRGLVREGSAPSFAGQPQSAELGAVRTGIEALEYEKRNLRQRVEEAKKVRATEISAEATFAVPEDWLRKQVNASALDLEVSPALQSLLHLSEDELNAVEESVTAAHDRIREIEAAHLSLATEEDGSTFFRVAPWHDDSDGIAVLQRLDGEIRSTLGDERGRFVSEQFLEDVYCGLVVRQP